MKKSLIKTLLCAALLSGSAVALASCGNAEEEALVYTGYRNDSEAGFDELVFPVAQDIVLTGSKYVYSESTMLTHTIAKSIVASHLYNFEGTFSVVEENKEEGTKTIKLSAPTFGIDKNTGTTLADDADLIDKFTIDSTVVLDVVNMKATFNTASAANVAGKVTAKSASTSAVYSGYRNDSEAGFDELVFPVAENLVLTGSKYVYSESTLLTHTIAKNIVASHLYNFEGTFKVISEDKEEGTKTIELSTPTAGIDKNTGTTLAADPELADKFVISKTVVINPTLFTATFTLAE